MTHIARGFLFTTNKIAKYSSFHLRLENLYRRFKLCISNLILGQIFVSNFTNVHILAHKLRSTS